MDISFLYNELDALKRVISVVDIGASNLGGYETQYDKLLKLGRVSVTGFEPAQDAFEELCKNNQDPNKIFHQKFIGDGEQRTFFETNWSLTGSLYPPNTALLEKFQNLAELVTPIAEHSVQTHRLDDIPGLERMDFLKMDVQGAELDVLRNCPNLLSTCLVAQLEVEFVELYEGQPLFADVDAFMRSQGFQFHKFDKSISGRVFKPLSISESSYAKLNQCLWSDAWYVRDWMNLERVARDQLLIASILSLVICQSPDLALVYMTEYDSRYGCSLANDCRRELGV